MTGMSVRGTAVRSLPGSSVAGAHRFGSPPMAQAKQFSSLLNCQYFEFTWVRSSGLKTTTFSHALFFFGGKSCWNIWLSCVFKAWHWGFRISKGISNAQTYWWCFVSTKVRNSGHVPSNLIQFVYSGKSQVLTLDRGFKHHRIWQFQSFWRVRGWWANYRNITGQPHWKLVNPSNPQVGRLLQLPWFLFELRYGFHGLSISGATPEILQFFGFSMK